jgi:hypothetical protein
MIVGVMEPRLHCCRALPICSRWFASWGSRAAVQGGGANSVAIGDAMRPGISSWRVAMSSARMATRAWTCVEGLDDAGADLPLPAIGAPNYGR